MIYSSFKNEFGGSFIMITGMGSWTYTCAKTYLHICILFQLLLNKPKNLAWFQLFYFMQHQTYTNNQK